MGNAESAVEKEDPRRNLEKRVQNYSSSIVPGTVATSLSMKLPMPEQEVLEEKFNRVLVSRYFIAANLFVL